MADKFFGSSRTALAMLLRVRSGLLRGMEALGRRGIRLAAVAVAVGCAGADHGWRVRGAQDEPLLCERRGDRPGASCWLVESYPRSEIHLKVQGKMVKAFGGVAAPCPAKPPEA